MGSMLSKAQMQIFGDPDTMTRMTQQFMRAASYGTAMEGLASTLPPGARDVLSGLGVTVAAQLAKAGNGNGHGNGHSDEAAEIVPPAESAAEPAARA
jgi:hypothetical protein